MDNVCPVQLVKYCLITQAYMKKLYYEKAIPNCSMIAQLKNINNLIISILIFIQPKAETSFTMTYTNKFIKIQLGNEN